MLRASRIALPFLLLALGAVMFYRSPWPTILHLMITGARVRVVPTWQTVGLPAIAAGCWALAIGLSLRVKRQD